jgi:pimeloyl-ACP methyl ester carboxylesterase
MVTSTELPQAPEPVAVQVPSGTGALEGVTWPWPTSDLALLVLHDLDADLDSVRWLCERAASAGVHVLAVDLPGHGLSGGDISAEGPEAVAASVRFLADGFSGAVGVVARGRSAELLLTTDVVTNGPVHPPVAVALLDPARRAEGPGPSAMCWEHVPKLVILSKGAPDDYAKEIIAGTTAWCLRADLVGLGEDTSDREGFEIHVVSLALKFLLEQAAFELSSRRMAAAALVDGGGADDAGVDGDGEVKG